MFRTTVSIVERIFDRQLYLPNIIISIRMTPFHKVWNLSLGGQWVVHTGVGMFWLCHIVIGFSPLPPTIQLTTYIEVYS